MSENNKKDTEKAEEVQKDALDKKTEVTVEQKLKETEEKLLRSLAEIENQRRRFEKEIKDAFEFGSFNFAKESLAILDNLDRAKIAIQNDEILKSNKDLENKIKVIQAKEKQLKLVSAISDDSENKQYFKNKIDYLIQEIDYCIDRISV